MMRLGLGSYACAWAINSGVLDSVGVIRRARALGLRVVQLSDNLTIQNATSEDLALIRCAADEAAIELELGARGTDPDHLGRYLDVCGKLRARLLRLVVDTSQHHPSAAEVIHVMSGLVSTLEQCQVVVAIENHDRFPARTLAKIIKTIGSARVGVCLDTVNSFGAAEGPEQVIEALGAHVINLHIKDFVITREPHMMGFRITGAPPGQGMLDIRFVLDRLQFLGAQGNAILELWPPPDADTGSTIAKEARWCEEGVRYLRAFIPD
jgi:sugar phosphate isomerase/epimerase